MPEGKSSCRNPAVLAITELRVMVVDADLTADRYQFRAQTSDGRQFAHMKTNGIRQVGWRADLTSDDL
jgi:hypothetical protein